METEHNMSAEVFLLLGLSMVMSSSFQRNSAVVEDICFMTNFGAPSSIVAILWNMLRSNLELDPFFKPKHLLWTLLFLKTYPTLYVLATRVGADKKTVRKWVWYGIFALADLVDDVVKWEDRLINDVGALCLVTVDGTDFLINEPRPFSTKWYSHKFHGPGLRYELAECIQMGLIVWFNGPFPCGQWPDIAIFHQALIMMLGHRLNGHREMVEADNGYTGEGMHIRIADEQNISVIQAICKGRARVRHEAVNGRYKAFGILKLTFRHDLQLHGPVFRAVTVIVNIAMANGYPTFEVLYPAPGNA